MILGIIAGFVSLCAFIPYIYSIFKGETVPNRVTWFIWSVVGILLFLSYRASGAQSTLWVAGAYILGPIVISILGLRYGVGGWSKFDIACLGSALLTTAIWYITASSTIALALFLAIDFCGVLPTLRKSYYHPEQENRTAWFLIVVGNMLNMFAAEKMTFTILAYPVYMFVSGTAIFALLFRKGK